MTQVLKDTLSSPPTLLELAPPFMKLPITGYGGIERVLWSIVREFVKAADRDPHAPKVELWAPGDSATDVDGLPITLVPTIEKARPASDGLWDSLARQIPEDAYNIRRRLVNDPSAIAHIHTQGVGFGIIGGAGLDVATRAITTLHNGIEPWMSEFHKEMPIIPISHAQARSVAGFDFVRVVHNGIDGHNLQPNFDLAPDAPFTFLGRFHPNKGTLNAIKIALAADGVIRLAGSSDPDFPKYVNDIMEMANQYPERVEIVGEITDHFVPQFGQTEKSHFLSTSRALLFPIQWKEPFGLVIAEANACGTPVIAFNYPGSSVDELIVDGVNGRKVNTIEEAIEAAKTIDTIDRHGVRKYFEEHFTSEVMAQNYRRVITEELPAYRRELGL